MRTLLAHKIQNISFMEHIEVKAKDTDFYYLG